MSSNAHHIVFANEKGGDQNNLILKKHHLALVQELENGNLASVIMNRKLEKLKNFDEIEDVPSPVKFKGVLRPYQKAGYNWLSFLHQYKFGGCLADDMGLGKTLQVIALLLRETELRKVPSLVIAPATLLENWRREIVRFAPVLSTTIHRGQGRSGFPKTLRTFDVVLTSYDTAMRDISTMCR